MVKIVTIGSLLTRKRNIAKNLGEEVPVYAVTNDKGFALSSDLHDFTIHSDDTSNYLVVEKNDFAYNPSRLNIGSIAIFDKNGKGLISPMYVVFHADEQKILPKYLFIVIKSEAIKNKIDSLKEIGARFRFDYERWNLIEIPIPSLSEQQRIVTILGTFTSAIDNLKDQIAFRRKQYEFYRDQLLNLEGKEGVEMKSIIDVFELRNGYTPSKNNPKFWENGTIPWFRMEDIRENGRILKDSIQHITPMGVKKSGLFPAGSFILATTATIGEHALLIADSLANQRFTNLKIRESLDSMIDVKYVYYYMFILDDWCKKNTNISGFSSVDMEKFKKLSFPIPPLSDQHRIVAILDTFETSIANLEAQLKEREKQYEYYRNKLLTFE